MIPNKLNQLIEKYCMGLSPTDRQLDEIMNLAIELSVDSSEVAAYIEKMQNAPTKEELEAERKAKAEAERKAKAEAERKAKAEAERKEKAEAERKVKAEVEREEKNKGCTLKLLIFSYILILILQFIFLYSESIHSETVLLIGFGIAGCIGAVLAFRKQIKEIKESKDNTIINFVFILLFRLVGFLLGSMMHLASVGIVLGLCMYFKS